MTWTVFEHDVGDNETTDDAPGRGGYKYVLAPLDSEAATEWWVEQYGTDPHRYCSYSECDARCVWQVEQYDDEEIARKQCGEMEMDAGGIGSPMTRLYTWDELAGRLDVNVVTEGEVDDATK